MRLHDIPLLPRVYRVSDPDAFWWTMEQARIDIDAEMRDTHLRNLYIVYPGTHMAELIATRDPRRVTTHADTLRVGDSVTL